MHIALSSLPFFQTVKKPDSRHDEKSMMLREKLVKQDSQSQFGNTRLRQMHCTSYKAGVHQDLRQFRKRTLHQHVHLENNILFPRAVEMETGVV